jgi:tRNA-specific 2-thiouridylase
VVALEDGEDGVSPGQACVLYSSPGAEARVYGGGFIKAAGRDAAHDRLIASAIEGARRLAAA